MASCSHCEGIYITILTGHNCEKTIISSQLTEPHKYDMSRLQANTAANITVILHWHWH